MKSGVGSTQTKNFGHYIHFAGNVLLWGKSVIRIENIFLKSTLAVEVARKPPGRRIQAGEPPAKRRVEQPGRPRIGAGNAAPARCESATPPGNRTRR